MGHLPSQYVDSVRNKLRQNLRAATMRFLERLKPRKLRSYLRFAEEEIVLPNGPLKGQRFRRQSQPVHALWLDELEHSTYRQRVFIGPRQSGKTLAGFVILLMWHLFEYGEDVAIGLPNMDVAKNKWKKDIMPVIKASRYAKFLPKTGSGSKGGVQQVVQFENGVALSFITAGGGDKSGGKAGDTYRVIFMTEVNDFGAEASSGEEGLDPVTQMIQGTASFGTRARIYMECTMADEQCRINTEYQAGTASRVVMPCHNCGRLVEPTRENLVGWQTAEDEIAAGEGASFECPSCHASWSEQQRRAALMRAALMHKTHTLNDDGESLMGDMPRTRTLSMKYTAAHNVFQPAEVLGAEEWRAKNEPDVVQSDMQDRAIKQYRWAVPIPPDSVDEDPLDVRMLMARYHKDEFERPLVPRGTLTPGDVDMWAGVDVRKKELHWVAGCRDSIVEFGIEPVPWQSMPLADALQVAKDKLADVFDEGFAVVDDGGELLCMSSPKLVLIDAGWEQEAVFAVTEDDPAWMPSKGFGYKQMAGSKYNAPKDVKDDESLVETARLFHFAKINGVTLVEVNADLGKTRLHQALSVAGDSDNALMLPGVDSPYELQEFAQHLCAEKYVREWDTKGKGERAFWKTISRHNHWLDAAYLMLVARDVWQQQQAKRNAAKELLKTLRAGRTEQQGGSDAFLVTDR